MYSGTNISSIQASNTVPIKGYNRSTVGSYRPSSYNRNSDYNNIRTHNANIN